MPSVTRRSLRRSLLAPLSLTLGASLALLPAPAQAARTPFIVVGTSDVSDSFLMKGVLEPGFEAAYPQYDLQYVPKGTGAAIAYAETGAAAAMIVHAESLENQFNAAVGPGGGRYSAETYGRAVFYGDYVLAGPASDPAGVLTNAPHDVVTAFERIYAAGQAGTAEFVSRGGTPGTAVQERAIWGLTGSSVKKCDVGTANGGGFSPTTDDTQAQNGCPTLNAIAYPSWYHLGDSASQANNVNIANACNFGHGQDCYVFTDRGTLQFLQATGGATGLTIDTRDNDPAARGGIDALINYFHAYAVNPGAFTSAGATNLPAALAFMNYLQAPSTQATVSNYLGTDPPFIADAAPSLTASGVPAVVTAGHGFTVTGHLANVAPGTPALDAISVAVKGTPTADPSAGVTKVATGVTDANGDYSIHVVPRASMSYTVSVGPITKIERTDLSPQFGDLLAPQSTAVGTVDVQSRLKKVKARKAGKKGLKLRLTGKISPASYGAGKLVLYVAHPGRQLQRKGARRVAAGTGRFDVSFKLGKGTWNYQLTWLNPNVLSDSTTVRKVSLP